jgi:thioredoxin reductase
MSTEISSRFDVVIVGAGPAGLSAALVLGRSRRRVLLFDKGDPRNSVTGRLHAFLTRDGCGLAEFRKTARNDLERYPTVEVRDEEVAGAIVADGGFEVTTAAGERIACRKLLLATGLADDLPDLPGFTEIYGKSAFHCPYCDGWEWRDRALGVYGDAEIGRALALELLGWSDDLVLFTDGDQSLDAAARAELARSGIRLVEDDVAAIEAEEGKLRQLVLVGGTKVARDALFFAAPTKQRCGIVAALGCEFDEKGAVKTRAYERTHLRGLYVAGDASRHVELAIVAAAEGAMAAFAINSELLAEDRR